MRRRRENEGPCLEKQLPPGCTRTVVSMPRTSSGARHQPRHWAHLCDQHTGQEAGHNQLPEGTLCPHLVTTPQGQGPLGLLVAWSFLHVFAQIESYSVSSFDFGFFCSILFMRFIHMLQVAIDYLFSLLCSIQCIDPSYCLCRHPGSFLEVTMWMHFCCVYAFRWDFWVSRHA